MSQPTTLDSVFASAYADALKYGAGFFSTRPLIDAMMAKHVPQSDVFRFRFIRGKSHAHSRKIWRERSERSPRWTSLQVSYELPKPFPDPSPLTRRLLTDMASLIDQAIFGALF